MKLPRTPAAVVFDMDGLLFDTEVLYQEAIQLAAAEGGHEVAIDVFNRTVGLPWVRAEPYFSPISAKHSRSISSRRRGSVISG
jgi:beta-phosphoglucomutase-like phosphatase (HAD superfamily)